MTASSPRRALTLATLASIASLAACASPASIASSGAGSVRFAVSTGAATASDATDPALPIRVTRSRVLARHVNLQEPIVMSADGDGSVAVTFAQRQHAGVTLAMDPASLASLSETPFQHAPHARPSFPPFLSGEPARVAVADGGSLTCWNDETSGRVLVQVSGSDGSWRGSPVVVSPEGVEVFGSPRLASVDGYRFVVSFFTNDEDGFDVVAASLEMPR